MGLSFYNDKSFEAVSGSLHFAYSSSDREQAESNITMNDIERDVASSVCYDMTQ